MAAQHCYTYRLTVDNRDRVRAAIRDPDDRIVGEPWGSLGYHPVARQRILELHESAIRGALSGRDDVEELGKQLFSVMFDDQLRLDFIKFYQERTRRENALLRLELDIDEATLPEIAALPWEFMRVPDSPAYASFWLSTSPDLVISRRRWQWTAPEPIRLAPTERLRIALVVADPANSDLGPVAYDQVWDVLQQLAAKRPNQVDLRGPVTEATTKRIDEVLEWRPHILHFIGHGKVQQDGDREVSTVVLVDVTGRAGPIEAREFGDLFRRHVPAIVVLQTCEGASGSDLHAFTSLAAEVLKHNVPVVVAMQYEVSNSTAQLFAREFYERLADNDPVDAAVQEGRLAVANGGVGYRRRDFATPVLYMQVRDGRLFDLPADGAETSPDGLAHHIDRASNPDEVADRNADVVPAADHYAQAVQAFVDQRWQEAIDLLELVSREDPDYRNVSDLVQQARDRLASERAELDVTLKAKPRQVRRGATATFTLIVGNYTALVFSDVVARDQSGHLLDQPFSLAPGESRRISITVHNVTTDVAKHVAVEASTPFGRRVRAEAHAKVSAISPPPRPPDVQPQPTPPQLTVIRPAATTAPVAPAPRVMQLHDLDEVIEQALELVDLDDVKTIQLIDLLKQGRRHYSVAAGTIPSPRGWNEDVGDWQIAVASASQAEAVAFVGISFETPESILLVVQSLAREIYRRLGKQIPVRELR